MSRRRKKRKLNWGPILFLLLLGNIIVGVFYSRLTAVTKVRVIGAQPEHQSAIRQHLAKMTGTPAMQVNAHGVESGLLALDPIRKAEFSRNVFGRATVKLEYRTPVATVVGRVPLALSSEGVIYRGEVTDDSLPSVRFSSPPEGTYATLTSPWPGGHIASLCQELKGLDATLPIEVVVSKAGAVELFIGDKFAVELGSTEGLEEKLDVLKQHVQRDREMLERSETLVLVAPAQPVVRPRGTKE